LPRDCCGPAMKNGATGGRASGARFSALRRTGTRDDGKTTAASHSGDSMDPSEMRRRRTNGVENSAQRSMLPGMNELKWVDQFAYYPTYRYHPYRSMCGAICSVLFVSIFLLRMISSFADFAGRPPIVTEAREQFPRDSTEQFEVPRMGVQFRQNGWLPFNDPRYISIVFDQGVIHRSGNVTYTDLGSRECSFVDQAGRLIADDARCPAASGDVAGYMQGDFHDVTFAFVRARLLRCDNGTDVEGKPLPGMCHMPEEINRLVYEGVLYMLEQETDMRVDTPDPFLRIRQWRREFISNVHISTDVFFTRRQVTQEARYIFDAYMPGFDSGSSFVLMHDYQETYTDFDESAAQYAAFYFRLASEMIRQRRSYTSLFALFETWGAIGAFLYFVFGMTARQWNTWNFHRQVRGLDIRKLDKGQFTPLGRLIDKSFQMPREFQCMQAD